MHFAGMVPAADSAALPPGKNACEASHIFTRSVAHLYTLCVYRAAPDTPGNAAKRQGFNLDCTILQLRYADSRFAKPRKFPKGNGFTFFSLLRKEPKVAEGPRPSRLPENGSKLYRIVFSWHFRLSSLNRDVVRPTFKDVLNRCERVAIVQTQD